MDSSFKNSYAAMISSKILEHFFSLPFPHYQLLCLYLGKQLRKGNTDNFIHCYDQLSSKHVTRVIDTLRDLHDLSDSEWNELYESFSANHSDISIFSETEVLDRRLFGSDQSPIDAEETFPGWRTVLTTSVHETSLSSSPQRPEFLSSETDSLCCVPHLDSCKASKPLFVTASVGTTVNMSDCLPSPVSDAGKPVNSTKAKTNRNKKKKKKRKLALPKADSAIDIHQSELLSGSCELIDSEQRNISLEAAQPTEPEFPSNGFADDSEPASIRLCNEHEFDMDLLSLSSLESDFSEAPISEALHSDAFSISDSSEVPELAETPPRPKALLNLYDIKVRPNTFVNLPPLSAKELRDIRLGKTLPSAFQVSLCSSSHSRALDWNTKEQESMLLDDLEFQLYLYSRNHNFEWPLIPQLK